MSCLRLNIGHCPIKNKSKLVDVTYFVLFPIKLLNNATVYIYFFILNSVF